jgi:hypothetical protein
MNDSMPKFIVKYCISYATHINQPHFIYSGTLNQHLCLHLMWKHEISLESKPWSKFCCFYKWRLFTLIVTFCFFHVKHSAIFYFQLIKQNETVVNYVIVIKTCKQFNTHKSSVISHFVSTNYVRSSQLCWLFCCKQMYASCM